MPFQRRDFDTLCKNHRIFALHSIFQFFITRRLTSTTSTSPLLARHAILLHREGTRDKARQVFYFPHGFLGQSPSLEKYVLIHQDADAMQVFWVLGHFFVSGWNTWQQGEFAFFYGNNCVLCVTFRGVKIDFYFSSLPLSKRVQHFLSDPLSLMVLGMDQHWLMQF